MIPEINSIEYKEWLQVNGYKNKGYNDYEKQGKRYCFRMLYTKFKSEFEA